MQKGIQKGCALLLGMVLAVSGMMQPLGMQVFADEKATVSSSSSAVASEALDENAPADITGAEESSDSQSDASLSTAQKPDAEVLPSPTPTPLPSPTPSPTPTPEPTPEPEMTELTPSPEESPTPTPAEDTEELTLEQLKEKIQELLEKSRDLTQLSEEELQQTAEEMEKVAAVPMALDGEEDQELQDLLDQLANAKEAVENMQLAYQAQREGWLDKLPQTGLENSWRYQNGQLLEENETENDLRAGVSFFSAGGYWGIDVSHHQGVIDWEAVKNAGIDFAMIRCGFGDDETKQDDQQWARNVSECERLGIPYGVYFYSYALTADMAVSEGQHALRLLQGHTPALPVFYDMEENSQLVLGNAGLAEIARIFTDIVSAQGYEVGVYANLNWWNNYLTDPVFDNWYRWVAEWRSSCSYGGRYEMWPGNRCMGILYVRKNRSLLQWFGRKSIWLVVCPRWICGHELYRYRNKLLWFLGVPQWSD